MAENEKIPCTICKDKTPVVFNIDFTAVLICESCAVAITVQQVKYWSEVK